MLLMKPMNNWKLEDAVSQLMGLFGGCMAYIHFDMLRIDWGQVGTSAMHLLWTCTVALLSGAMGWLGKKLVEKHWNKKHKSK